MNIKYQSIYMKSITVLYIYLYISHIFLGPYYVWFLFTDTPFKLMSKDWTEVLRRSIWLTYIGFLCIALLNEYPNPETFLSAFIVSMVSMIGYLIKFKGSVEYIKGIVDHVCFLIIPLGILYVYYNINLNTYKPTYLSLVVVMYILSMTYFHRILYKN
jgi:hypothetical protein